MSQLNSLRLSYSHHFSRYLVIIVTYNWFTDWKKLQLRKNFFHYTIYTDILRPTHYSAPSRRLSILRERQTLVAAHPLHGWWKFYLLYNLMKFDIPHCWIFHASVLKCSSLAKVLAIFPAKKNRSTLISATAGTNCVIKKIWNFSIYRAGNDVSNTIFW